MEPRPPEPTDSVLTDYEPPQAGRDRWGLHVGLFLATFFSVTWCGGFLAARDRLWSLGDGGLLAWLAVLADPDFLHDGLLYAVAFLGFLTVHEFGHYTAARLLKTRVSPPFYIPIPIPFTLGTFGAVIQIKEPLRRTRQLFDIGAAGPLAGFVVALGVLVAAVLTLPGPEYFQDMSGPSHAETVRQLAADGTFPTFDPASLGPNGSAMVLGDTPLFHLVSGLGWVRVPGHEIAHYPLLIAGWLGLFFTALNLLPVGQLDGGHVVYAMFGPRVHGVVARVTTLLLLFSGAVGAARDLSSPPGAELAPWTLWVGLALVLSLALARLFDGDWRLVGPATVVGTALVAAVVLALPELAARVGWGGWLFWVGMILFVIKVDHPPVLVQEPLTPTRKALGWLCIVIFALCFSIQPIQVLGG